MILDPKALKAAGEVYLSEQVEIQAPGQLDWATSEISSAIQAFIDHPDSGLVERRKYDDMVRTALRDNNEARQEADKQGKQLAALREAVELVVDLPIRHITPLRMRNLRTALTDTAEAAEGWVKVPEGRIIVSLSAVVGAVKLGRDFYKDCGTSPCLYPDWLRELGVSVDNAFDAAPKAGEGTG